MSQTIEALAMRLQALEDREEIRQLVASYGPLADCGDADALAALWVEDGEYEIAGFATACGHGEIAALIEGSVHRELMAAGCAHLLGPVSVEITGDSAVARGHSVVFRHEGGAFAAHRVSANRWTLKRTDAGWRVTHRANALLDGDDAARMLLATSPPHHPAS